jgi:hypothetical protein
MLSFLLWCFALSTIGTALFIVIEHQVIKNLDANKFTKWWREHIVAEYNGNDF